MAPLIPRTHLFEIHDQPWFPDFLRARVQDSLTVSWATNPFSGLTGAQHAASVLIKELGNDLSSYTFIDFCAGAGGPTPIIERAVNAYLLDRGRPPVDFVLTDLHPNTTAWARLARESCNIKYESASIDASQAPQHLVRRQNGKNVLRLFNLAFHHFDDPLASGILKDTVSKSQGFAIFELQDRSIASAITITLLGIGIFLAAPFYAWKWRSPATIIFTYLIPILPFVLVFDGYMSSIRTRTPQELEMLLRGCGADTGAWVIHSGRDRFLWPCGYLNWIVCRPITQGRNE